MNARPFHVLMVLDLKPCSSSVFTTAFSFESHLDTHSGPYPPYSWEPEARRSRARTYRWMLRHDCEVDLSDHQVFELVSLDQCSADWPATAQSLAAMDVVQRASRSELDVVSAIKLLVDRLTKAERGAPLARTPSFASDRFWRLRGDRVVAYGDGGESELFYPVYLSRTKSKQLCARLAAGLMTLDDERQDRHGGVSPVHDIIDPNLAPCKLSSLDEAYDVDLGAIARDDELRRDPGNRESMRSASRLMATRLSQVPIDLAGSSSSSSSPSDGPEKVKSQVRTTRTDFRYRLKVGLAAQDAKIRQELAQEARRHARYYRGASREEVRAEHYRDEATRLREIVRWLPAEVDIYPDNKVEFLSPIHQLPRNKRNRQLYLDIAAHLSEMIPQFEAVGAVPPRPRSGPVRRQVVVKAQMYAMKPSMQYGGHWHIEGRTEHIVAAGVVYLKADRALTGGQLIFCPPEVPGQSYDIDREIEIPVQSGTQIVWSNQMPHRMANLYHGEPTSSSTSTSSTSAECVRLFLNFFFVCPDRPITSTGNAYSEWLLEYLRELCPRLARGHALPIELAQRIVRLSGTRPAPRPWKPGGQAERFREYYRAVQARAKSGWGYCHYGNCGVTTFIEAEEGHDLSDFYDGLQKLNVP